MAARKTTTKARARKAKARTGKDLVARSVGDRDARRVRGGKDSLKTFKATIYSEAVKFNINNREA